MARKNIDFANRLEMTIKESGLDYRDFSEKAKIGYTTLMNYLVPGSRGRVPEWDQLVKISEFTKKSIDWLLTGKEPHVAVTTPQCPLCGDMTEETKDLCKKVKEIIESKNIAFASALKTVVTVFDQYQYEGKEKREPIRKLKQNILTL